MVVFVHEEDPVARLWITAKLGESGHSASPVDSLRSLSSKLTALPKDSSAVLVSAISLDKQDRKHTSEHLAALRRAKGLNLPIVVVSPTPNNVPFLAQESYAEVSDVVYSRMTANGVGGLRGLTNEILAYLKNHNQVEVTA